MFQRNHDNDMATRSAVLKFYHKWYFVVSYLKTVKGTLVGSLCCPTVCLSDSVSLSVCPSVWLCLYVRLSRPFFSERGKGIKLKLLANTQVYGPRKVWKSLEVNTFKRWHIFFDLKLLRNFTRTSNALL